MNQHAIRDLLLPIAVLIAAMLSIQVGAAIAKQLLGDLGAYGTATLRLCFAAFILCIVCRPWRIRLEKVSLLPLLLYGLSMGCMNVLIYLALMRIPLGIAVALEFMGPLAVAIWASRRPIDFIWIALATLGVLALLPTTDSQAALPWQGIAYALAAGVCWALYIIFGQKAGAFAPSGIVTSIGMTVAALAVTPIGIAHAGSELLNQSFWPTALMIACLSSALPYWLEMMALKRLPAKTFGVLMSVEPAIAALSGLIILDERLTIMQWGAVASVMLASAGAVLGARRHAVSTEMVG
jgi:inner membrane transporter RhtA